MKNMLKMLVTSVVFIVVLVVALLNGDFLSFDPQKAEQAMKILKENLDNATSNIAEELGVDGITIDPNKSITENINDVVDNITETVKTEIVDKTIEAAKDNVTAAVEAVQDNVTQAIEAVEDNVTQTIESAQEEVEKEIEKAKEAEQNSTSGKIVM